MLLMKNKFINFLLFIISIGFLNLYSCDSSIIDEKSLEKIIIKETSKNKRYDSIVHGVKLGMTNDDFYYLDITDKIKTKSPYATEYKIIIDNTNKIHRVLGYSDFINLDICQAVRKDVLSKVEDKYETNFRFIERNYPKFSIYLNSNIDSAGNEYRIQCRLWNEDSSSALQILLDSEVLANSIYDFFNSGL